MGRERLTNTEQHTRINKKGRTGSQMIQDSKHQGEINIGQRTLKNYTGASWRFHCSESVEEGITALQDHVYFSQANFALRVRAFILSPLSLFIVATNLQCPWCLCLWMHHVGKCSQVFVTNRGKQHAIPNSTKMTILNAKISFALKSSWLLRYKCISCFLDDSLCRFVAFIRSVTLWGTGSCLSPGRANYLTHSTLIARDSLCFEHMPITANCQGY